MMNRSDPLLIYKNSMNWLNQQLPSSTDWELLRSHSEDSNHQNPLVTVFFESCFPLQIAHRELLLIFWMCFLFCFYLQILAHHLLFILLKFVTLHTYMNYKHHIHIWFTHLALSYTIKFVHQLEWTTIFCFINFKLFIKDSKTNKKTEIYIQTYKIIWTYSTNLKRIRAEANTYTHKHTHGTTATKWHEQK